MHRASLLSLTNYIRHGRGYQVSCCKSYRRNVLVVPLHDSLKGPAPVSSHKTVQVGDVLDLVCKELGYLGQGVCKTEEGFVLFVDKALPGESFRAQVEKVKNGYGVASKVEVLRRHEGWVDARCPHFGTCGGCNFQNLSYQLQLEAKARQVETMFQRIGKVSKQDFVLDIVGCPDVYEYRNSTRFSASPNNFFGLLESGTNVVVEIQHCALQDGTADRILAVANQTLKECSTFFGEPLCCGQGGLQSLTVRKGRDEPGQSKYMVIVASSVGGSKSRRSEQEGSSAGQRVLSSAVQKFLQELTHKLCKEVPSVAGVIHEQSKVVKGQQKTTHRVLFGETHLKQRHCGLDFLVGPATFYQTNPAQLENLCQAVISSAGLAEGGTDTVLDLYCGGGALALPLAGGARQVVGADSNASAIADAIISADRNGIRNAAFHTLNLYLERDVTTLSQLVPSPDVIIADPGRDGLSPAIRKFMFNSGARRIVYVSCNPSTQARDMSELCMSGRYTLERAVAFDMFPQTYHIECMAVLHSKALLK
eukprot:jgi/Botrbrau1/16419/Bobra.0142s0018.1